MNNLKSNLLELIGRIAVAHPEGWIYSFVLAGVAIGLLAMGGIGFAIGNAIHFGTQGMYLGLAYYAYWFTTNVEELKGAADAQVAVLKSFKQ